MLLKKVDRCKMIIKIVKISNAGSDDKYMQQLISILTQLPDDSNEKFPLSCELLELLLGTPTSKLQKNEEMIYEWALKESKKDSGKEIEFYSIKLKYDSSFKNITDNVSSVEITESSLNFNEDDTVILTELTSEDLQKLKIFQSFDL